MAHRRLAHLNSAPRKFTAAIPTINDNATDAAVMVRAKHKPTGLPFAGFPVASASFWCRRRIRWRRRACGTLRRRRVPGGGVMARDAARDRAEKGMVSGIVAGDATHYGALDAALRPSPAGWQCKCESGGGDRE